MPRGRPKGSQNKFTKELKEAILEAANEAGGQEKLVGYLRTQAIKNPGPFMGLLGKVLPSTMTQEGTVKVVHEAIERVIVRPDTVDESDRQAVH